MTIAKQRAAAAKVNFRYPHRISFLACINAEGKSFVPSPVFKGQREPTFTVHAVPTCVADMIPSGWKAFWRKEMASVDSESFYRWGTVFVKVVREEYCNA